MTDGSHRRLTWLATALLLAACSGASGTPIIVYVTPAPPAATAAASPAAEPAAGSGLITFGSKYDHDTLLIAKPITRFKRTISAIAWSADLNRPVNATTIQWVVASQSATGVEVTIFDEEHRVSNPGSDLLANSGDLAFLVNNKAGTYVMRYIESGEVLAEGTFTLVK